MGPIRSIRPSRPILLTFPFTNLQPVAFDAYGEDAASLLNASCKSASFTGLLM